MIKRFLLILLCLTFSARVVSGELGRVAAGTTVIASDTKLGRAFSPGKLIDGNPRTFWQSLPTAGDKFLEFNWRQIFTIDKVTLDWMYQPGKPQKKLKYWDFEKQQWQNVPELKISAKGNIETYDFAKVKTDKIRFTFSKPTAGFLRIRSAKINSCDPVPPQSQWKAKWLWTKDKDRKIAVRTSFNVKDPDKVVSAWVQLAADDVCYPYLNGKRFGTAAAFYNPRVFGMPKFKKGINYFTASATDAGGARGFIAEIVINYKEDGKVKTMIVNSDKTWDCQPFKLYAVTNPTDNKGWKKAIERHDSPPNCPWGEVRHVNTAYNPDKFEIKNINVPATLEPGSWMKGTIEVSSPAKPNRNYAFVLELKNTGTTLNKSDLRVSSSLGQLKLEN